MTEMGNAISADGYSQIAGLYQFLELMMFGGDLHRARLRLLPLVPDSGPFLVLGDGDGRFLEELVQRFPTCSVVSVDHSQRMLDLQRKRIENLSRSGLVTFRCGDIRSLTFSKASFSGIFVNFFLDCFTDTELDEFLPVWLGWLDEGGLLYYSDFQQPNSGFQKIRGRLVLDLLHRFFRYQTGLSNRQLPDFDSLFERLPMELLCREEGSGGLLTTRLFRVH